MSHADFTTSILAAIFDTEGCVNWLDDVQACALGRQHGIPHLDFNDVKWVLSALRTAGDSSTPTQDIPPAQELQDALLARFTLPCRTERAPAGFKPSVRALDSALPGDSVALDIFARLQSSAPG